MISQEWHVKSPDIEKSCALAVSLEVSPILAQLLVNRGIETAKTARSYLYPTLADLSDPFLMHDMEKAVDRIRMAKEKGEQVWVYGASDVDGTMATALLLSIFHQLDVPASYYIADCFTEGYGLNKEVVTTLKEKGCNLLITIACGITSFEEVQLANEFGLDVIIICLNHVCPNLLPPAYAVVTPQMAGNNHLSHALSGVTVTFKLAHALMRGVEQTHLLVDQLDLVALGIIVHGAKLKGENRTLAKLGLEEINHRHRPGIRALCDVTFLGVGTPIVAHTLDLVLGSRINPTERTDTASKVVELLTTESYEVALSIAKELDANNTERRKRVQQVEGEAIDLVEKKVELDEVKGLVLAQKGWHRGAVDIVAKRLLERYHRPVFLLSIEGDKAYGSGRSIEKVNLATSLNSAPHLLLTHGGHKTAVGLTIRTEKIVEFERHFNQYASECLSEEDLVPKLYLDDIQASHVTSDAIEEINLLEPFGEDNPPPQLAIRGLALGIQGLFEAAGWRIGWTTDYLIASKSQNTCEDSVDLAVTPEISEWHGARRPQLVIKDLYNTPRFVRNDFHGKVGCHAPPTAADRKLRQKKWQVKSCCVEDSTMLAEKLEVSPLIAHLLVNRGIKTVEAAQTYLYPTITDLHDPFLVHDMEKAVERIHSAKKKGEQIWVYGDYDTDGTTATALLLSIFRYLDMPARFYIPNRFEEGYGLNKEAVKTLRNKGCDLVITVDCGITSVHEVQLANEVGMDVIITDHHQAPPDALPSAHAVITPKMVDSNYPFDGLAGVGLAFKLAHGLMGGGELTQPLIDQLDLVVLGTVVDMATLTGENRTLTRLGLAEINHRKRPGIHALCEVAGFSGDKPIVGHTLGFVLGPRINAAGRMATARKVVELLTVESEEDALPIASELDYNNTERRKVEGMIHDEAINLAEKEGNLDEVKGLVVAREGWHQGVVGIVASRIMQRYHRPVFLLAINGDEAHGSGRSIEGLNLANSLNAATHLLVKHGGHKAAAGLTIKTENIQKFKELFNQYACEHLSEEDLVPKLDLDFDVQASHLTFNAIEELNLLEPFGEDNPAPQLALRGLTLRCAPQRVGKQKEHLKLSVTDGRCGLDAVGWRMGWMAEYYIMMKQRKWEVKFPDIEKSSALAVKLGVSPFITQLLINRGIETEEDARKFLFPTPANLHDPFLINDMEKAVDRIQSAKKKGETIWIYGDYDTNGTTAAALLLSIFRDLDVPNQFQVECGLNKETVKTLRDKGCRLIITVGCRSTSPATVNLANEVGMDVIITNRHQPPSDIRSSAYAVITPQMDDCERSSGGLTGVGLAFKLAHGMMGGGEPTQPLIDQLDLVVLGTVVDMATLTGENRILTRLGLAEINHRKRPGIHALCEVASFSDNKPIVGHTLQYVLGPRLNAAGRLGMGQKIVESLTTKSYDVARPIVQELEGKIAEQTDEERESHKTHFKKLYLDFDVQASHLTLNAIEKLNLLEPFGEGNPTPQLAVRDLTLRRPPRLMGKRNQHLKLSVTDGNHMLEAIGWGMSDFVIALKSKNVRLDLAVTPVINEWQDTRTPQLVIKDIHIRTIERNFQENLYPSDDTDSPVKLVDRRNTDKKTFISNLLERAEPIVFYVRDGKAIDRFLDLIGPQSELIGRCDDATSESEIEGLIDALASGKLLAIVTSRTLMAASEGVKHFVFCHPVCTPLTFYNRCQPAFRLPETTYIHLIYSAKDADSMHTLLSWQYPDEETLKKLYQTITSLGSQSDAPIRLDEVVAAARTNSIPPDAVCNGIGIFEELKLIKSREPSSGKVVQLLPTPSEKRKLHQSRTYLYGEQLKQTSAIFSEFQLKQTVQEVWKRVSYECRNSN